MCAKAPAVSLVACSDFLLWPVRVRPGQKEEFTLYVQPQFGEGNPGFDRIRLRSSSVAPLELVMLQAGSETLLGLGVGATLWPGDVRVESGESGSLDLIFPALVDRATLYAITFRTEVFLGNTQFAAQLLHSDIPERLQQVSAGQATELVESQSLVVVADLQQLPLLDVALVPDVVTPNGDGINDTFTPLYNKGESVLGFDNSNCPRFILEVSFKVFDRAGKEVFDIQFEKESSTLIHWDGKNNAGSPLAAGIYFYVSEVIFDVLPSAQRTKTYKGWIQLLK